VVVVVVLIYLQRDSTREATTASLASLATSRYQTGPLGSTAIAGRSGRHCLAAASFLGWSWRHSLVGSIACLRKDSAQSSTIIIASSCWFRTTAACWPPSCSSSNFTTACRRPDDGSSGLEWNRMAAVEQVLAAAMVVIGLVQCCSWQRDRCWQQHPRYSAAANLFAKLVWNQSWKYRWGCLRHWQQPMMRCWRWDHLKVMRPSRPL